MAGKVVTDMSVECDAKGRVTLVVSAALPNGVQEVIRHTLSLDEMYSLAGLLLGRLYAKAKNR